MLEIGQWYARDVYLHKAQVWLDNDVEASGPHKTVCGRKRHIHGSHHLGNADASRSRNSYTAMNKGCSVFALALFYKENVSQKSDKE